MNNPAKAQEYSQKIIASGNYPITTASQLTGGFNAITTPSWMWGADITLDMGLNLVSWWGQMDYYTYSYQSVGDYKTIDEVLRTSIRNDDVRKNQFQQVVAGYWFGSNKFYEPKKIRQGVRYIETDYIFMRVDEFHLLKAESLAKQGDAFLPEAKQALKTLLQNRITDLSFIDAVTNSSDLLKVIYQQSIIELRPGQGAALVRSAGNFAQLTSREGKYCVIKLPSGEVRQILSTCKATIGSVGNSDHGLESSGKAGRSRWQGRRPRNRGVVMNPVDHPMGGGEGRASGGHPRSRKGLYAKGLKTRAPKKQSSKYIIERRKK
jgi:hypothetical protein